MSGEWLKSSLAELIQVYKQHENLYNQKHKLYYNKQARNNSLQKILNEVKRNRQETTLPEIMRKIQTLRTQFGQEINKIEKSQSLGEDLIYKPKIWWFPHLEWIGDFMKTRTDSTPLSVKAKVATKIEKAEVPLFEFVDDGVDDTTDQFSTEYELAEYDTETTDIEPAAKKQKTYQPSKMIRASQCLDKQEDSGIRTIEYTLFNEDTADLVPSSSKKPTSQYLEIDVSSKQMEQHKRRSKTFGKFVSALLMDITDDKLFFTLQKDITNSIYEASIKQHELKKS